MDENFKKAIASHTSTILESSVIIKQSDKSTVKFIGLSEDVITADDFTAPALSLSESEIKQVDELVDNYTINLMQKITESETPIIYPTTEEYLGESFTETASNIFGFVQHTARGALVNAAASTVKTASDMGLVDKPTGLQGIAVAIKAYSIIAANKIGAIPAISGVGSVTSAFVAIPTALVGGGLIIGAIAGIGIYAFLSSDSNKLKRAEKRLAENIKRRDAVITAALTNDKKDFSKTLNKLTKEQIEISYEIDLFIKRLQSGNPDKESVKLDRALALVEAGKAGRLTGVKSFEKIASASDLQAAVRSL